MSEAVRPHRLTFACDDVKYIRKDRPEVWIPVEQVSGQMFIGYPCVSFIPGSQGMEEPTRYGDFVIDIDTKEIACQDAIKIVNWFQTVYGVDPDQWRVYLSGKKGVHLELPAEILGVEYGHKYLTIGFKRLAKDIEGELQVTLDVSMYNMGTPKPYRQPNCPRDTGTCKRQITFDDLYEITTDEEYRISCSGPGPTWQPEDISQNGMLAARIQAYLKEAEEQREIVNNAPKLTDDEIDRLKLDVPPCMMVLSQLTTPTKRTFNDIAIQLTAYAVTSGRSEYDLLGGCSAFIENYPSTSLNTIEKRYENCRARYRTMSANGNQHSCGGVLALKIPGFDCDNCSSKPAGEEITSGYMTKEDFLNDNNLTLQIPDDVLNPGGLISLGMEALSAPGMPDIKQYNLAVVLTTIANAIAGKLTCVGVWPNVFNIKVGSTSTGKTSSDKAMVRGLRAAGVYGFHGATSFASGPALLRALSDRPVQMMVIDECTSMFKRYDKGDPNSDGKREALMEVFSATGTIMSKVYSDKRNSIDICYPCLSMTGNATSAIFEAIQQDDFDTGIMQRFDFFAYDGPAPARKLLTSGTNDKILDFAAGIKKLMNARPADNNLVGMPPEGMESCFDVGLSANGEAALQEWSNNVTAMCNTAGSEGDKGILSRQFDLCVKYALIHMVATRPIEAIFLPINDIDIEYGIKVASMLAGWKTKVLRGKVTTGDFHKNCEIFKAAIRAVELTGNTPTFKLMCNRRPQLKNWKPRESAEVIEILKKRREIIIDESKKHTIYRLSKDR